MLRHLLCGEVGIKLWRRRHRWQCAGDFCEDFGLDGGADNLGDEVEDLAER